MRAVTIDADGRRLMLCELSAIQAVQCEQQGEGLACKLRLRGIDGAAAGAVAHNAALCAFSLQDEHGRVFNSARAAADTLTLEELARIAQRYQDSFMSGECFESGVNLGVKRKGAGGGGAV